jgi:hypothetical protein
MIFINIAIIMMNNNLKQRSNTVVPPRVSSQIVIMEADMLKKGFIGRYSKNHFRLEGDELKYAKSAKAKQYQKIDLKEAYVEIDQKSKTKRKFKIITPKHKMTIKADSIEKRDAWFQALNKITAQNNKENILRQAKISKKLAQSVKTRIQTPINKSWTSAEISAMLQKEGGNLSEGVSNAEKSYEILQNELHKIGSELESKKNKEKVQRLCLCVEEYKKQQD